MLATTSDAAVNNAVYSYGGSWYAIGGANTSYVPPNFTYSLQPVTSGNVQVTVQSSIAGPLFTVDGTTYTTPQTFTWASGGAHTIATTSPQGSGAGSRYNWNAWSDGGAISHTVSPTANTTYTANFTQQFLLTTTVIPPGSGTVTQQPASVFYDSGTSVQLTASPSGSYAFVNWTGDLSGTANPQSIMMSAPHSVTANFAGSTGGAAGFVTGFGLNSPAIRNDFGGYVGMSLVAGASPLNVKSVGRVCVAGNTGMHTVKFVNASNGADVAGGSAQVSMAGCTPGKFTYATLASPITLAAGTGYYLVSQETAGGDTWYDLGQVTGNSVAAVKSSVYFYGNNWIPYGAANMSYVPPDFQYTALAVSGPQPFVTAFNLNNQPTRNDFSDYVGMNLTVGANNLSVTTVGRVCIAGNGLSHVVLLLNADNRVVLGGANVNMSGCTPGQFVYTPLSSAITLTAGTSYFLASQEKSGGDSWYDQGSLTSTGAAQVNNSVYHYNGLWYSLGAVNTSYVPVNFLYQIAP